MNLEEYKKHVNEVNDNIENLLKDNEEELNFYYLLVNAFNQVCEERNNLEQALDKIEKYIEEHKVKHYKLIDRPDGIDIILLENEIDDLLKIIQKAKGDSKNEN